MSDLHRSQSYFVLLELLTTLSDEKSPSFFFLPYCCAECELKLRVCISNPHQWQQRQGPENKNWSRERRGQSVLNLEICGNSHLKYVQEVTSLLIQ